MSKVRKQPKKTRSQCTPTFAVDTGKLLYAAFERAVEDLGWDGDRNAVRGAIRARQWSAVLNLTKANPPQLYADARQYFAAAQVENLFKKVPFPGNDDACRLAAIAQFLSDEHHNLRVNQRWLAVQRMGDQGFRARNPLYARLLRRMQVFFRRMLGENPSMDDVGRFCDFGPGASVGVGGDATHVYAKLESQTCTASALNYAAAAVWSNTQMRALYLPQRRGICCIDPDRFREEFFARCTEQLVDYNKIDFVPKNAKTHRMTASEPTLNGFVQAGIGVSIAHKMRAMRPFLNIWSNERNKRLAKEGSKWDCNRKRTFVTLDMKSASQSLVRQVIKAVLELCPGWFHAMDCVRSPCYKMQYVAGDPLTEVKGTYQLFCSMGNGFCFPLQTAFFAAAVEAVLAETDCEGTYGVFGDDVILPQAAALLLIEWLRFLGVRTNTDKSFVFGPFRESCGADFFDGENVRPYVLDTWIETPRDLLILMNGIEQTPAYPLHSVWWGLWYSYGHKLRRFLRPHRGSPDSGLTAPTTRFFECNRLEDYDEALQRPRWDSYRTSPVQDDMPYAVRRSADAQMFLALRGCSVKYEKRAFADNGDTVICGVDGTPSPCYRRKTVTDILTV